jgi:type VI secretion system ImpA family protein
MPTSPLLSDDLLDPITAEQPVGADLRWTPEWDRIKEARRADDGLDSGKWVKKDRKASDWRLVKELLTTALRERSKDLQFALWLTEANIKLHGFPGLRDGLRITRELMVRYWDQGLYPTIEDGPEDRAGPFEWLNNKLVDSMTSIPITARADQGADYSFVELKDARRVGWEANWRGADGDIDEKKKKVYDQALKDGHISMDMFDSAVRETKRATYEELNADFQQTYDEFKSLERVIDDKFGDAAPNLSDCRTAVSEIKQAISDILDKKRRDEPDPPSVAVLQASPEGSVEQAQGSDAGNPLILRFPLLLSNMQGSQSPSAGSWQDAEMLVRSGQVEKGLAEMTRLAASETNGRSRFQRKLLLAETCLASKRERLARSILEELAEQIDKFQLEFWESSELIGSVWTKLHRLYQPGGEAPDPDRANKLYERLCRLDPWQALGCTER